MAQAGETLHDEINLQQVASEMTFVWLLMREGMPLKEYLDELNFFLMEIYDIDVKIEDENLAMILLDKWPQYCWVKWPRNN